jgi:ankyrin repeat protein
MRYILLFIIALFFYGCVAAYESEGYANAPDILEANILKGEDVNSQDEDGATKLINSATWGHLENVKVLLKHKADVNLQDNQGEVPLMALMAFDKKDDIEIFNLLVKNGAKVNIQDKDGETPLHYAVTSKRPEFTELLIKNGAKINIQSKEGETPLHYAVTWGKPEFTETLIKNGADMYIQDTDGALPLFNVCQNCYNFKGEDKNDVKQSHIDSAKQIIDIFIKNGFNINAKSPQGKKITNYYGCDTGERLNNYLRQKGLK